MTSPCRSSILTSQPRRRFFRPQAALAALSCLLCGAAHAQEAPVFRPLEHHAQAGAIIRHLNDSGLSVTSGAAGIADADLNGDGLPEALVRLSGGDIHIFALPPRRGVVPLGVIRRPNAVQIAGQSDFGVRRLIASGSALNDFTRRTYRWNPQERRYLPAE